VPNKTWLVFRMQVQTLVFNVTFVIILLSMPLLSVFSVVGINSLQLVDQGGSKVNLDQVGSFFSLGKGDVPSAGFVDQTGRITQYPDDFSMLVFVDEQTARQALAEGKIAGLYILPENYFEAGQITYFETSSQGMSWISGLAEIEQLFRNNVLAQDEALRQRLDAPLPNLETEYLSREAQVGYLNMLSLLVPVGMAMLFYLTISSVASLLFESLVVETSNQTIEVLMTSLSMRQLLIGKVLALGLVGLLLEVSWVGLSTLGFALTGQAQNLDLPVSLTPATGLWAVLFFLLGYAMYAALITSVGALVQRLREQWQVVMLILMPLFLPVLALLTSTVDLNTPWWLFLSLFPLTSPVGMFSRLILTDVPWWQVLLSIVILVLSSYYVLRLAVCLFRSQYLLAPHPWLVIKAWFGHLKQIIRRKWAKIRS
jgi:ABC-2 type transport system permease protein